MPAQKPPAVSFQVSRSDRSLIQQIVSRASKDGLISGEVQCVLLEIDLIAVHANGCAIRLGDLLAADRDVFAAEIAEIAERVDRRAGGLSGRGKLRFATAETVPA